MGSQPNLLGEREWVKEGVGMGADDHLEKARELYKRAFARIPCTEM